MMNEWHKCLIVWECLYLSFTMKENFTEMNFIRHFIIHFIMDFIRHLVTKEPELLNHVLCLVAQSCLTLYDTTDCSPPGYSIYGDSPGRNTGVGCCVFLQVIFPTHGSNPGFPHYRWIFTIRWTRKPFEPWRLWNNKCWFLLFFFLILSHWILW